MSDRARQFMPFSALKGYYELLRTKERVVVPKKELSEDYAEILSRKVLSLDEGMMVKVTYYSNGDYVVVEGILTDIDIERRYLTIVKTTIDLDDIYDIECDSIE